MKVDFFSFYKVLKNEDAVPFVSVKENKGLIAVADGLGGSGSFVHKLSRRDNRRLSDDLVKTFLDEYYNPKHDNPANNTNSFKDQSFEKWINELIKPMIDEEPDTSALWGSRIVIARFVYYVLNNENLDLKNKETRESIVNFIYKGLQNTKEKFDLETPPNFGQLTLPTTLVGLRYVINDDETIKADVVWAGDSRAYAILPKDGLKQLSQDDEDDSGGITNLFCIKQDNSSFGTKLHCNSYVLPSKSIAFVCSDGFFDPYTPIDNIGVEAVFLDCLSKSSSFEELKNNWYNHYKPLMHDDCSIAFIVFGFDSFKDLKDLYSARTSTIISAFNDYVKHKKIISMIEENDDSLKQYIINRANVKKEDIAQTIASEIMAKNNLEPLIVKEIKQAYQDIKCKQENLREENKKGLERDACFRVKKYLLEDPKNVLQGFLKNQTAFIPKVKDSINKYIAMVNSILEKESQKTSIEEKCKNNRLKLEDAENSGKALIQRIKEKEAEIEETLEFIESLKKKIEQCKLSNHANNTGDEYVSSTENQFANNDKLKQIDNNNQTIISSLSKKYLDTSNTVAGKMPLINTEDGFVRGIRVLNSLDSVKKAVLDTLDEQKELAEQNKNSLRKLVSFWANKEFLNEYKYQSYPCDAGFFDDIKTAIENYRDAEAGLEELKNMLERNKTSYNDKLNDYKASIQYTSDDMFLETVQKANDYYTEEARIQLELPICANQDFMSQEIVTNGILKFLQENNDVFDKMLQIFMDSESTIIDRFFNQSQLQTYRTYKSADVKEVEKIIEKIEKLLEAYNDVESIQASLDKI